MPPKPRWLLAIPDAIQQLEKLDRQLLTRRDIERLFGVGKVRAAALMKTFGAELVGNQRTLPRTKLLQQLKKHLGRAAFRRRGGETRAPGRRTPAGPADRGPVQGAGRDHERAAGEPARGGCPLLAAGSRCGSTGRRTPLARLYSLAQALGNDYGRFEELVGRGDGRGEVVTE